MTIPEVLWHYTDATGLHGILSSGRLRLTDVRFLNDRTERTYGSATISSRVDELIRDGKLDSKITDPKYAGVRIAGERLYVCSLTECGDALSQWQRYAADGAGYCIGFDARALLPTDSVDAVGFQLPPLSRLCRVYDTNLKRFTVVHDPPILRQMIYEKTLQNEKIDLWVREVISRTRSVMEAARYFDLALDELAVQFKNPLFEDEREWRLIQQANQHDSNDIVRFATTGHYRSTIR